ncbi:MAG: hypothetical protein ACRDSN_23295, partial [Pseudonocardiaceae bacterium]
MAIGAVAVLPGGAIAQGPPRANQQAPDLPNTAKRAVALADGTLRTTVRRLARGKRAPADVRVVGERVLVEVLVAPGKRSEAIARIADLRGRVEGSAGARLLQALVPADRLARLERSAAVRFLRAPLVANAPPDQGSNEANAPGQAVIGEEVAKAEKMVRAKVDSLVAAKVEPVKRQVAEVRTQAETRLATERKRLDDV